MFAPVYFLYGVLLFAVVALLVNIYVKLPKNVFGFLAVFTLVAICWTIMGKPEKVTVSRPLAPLQAPVISVLAESVSLHSGANNFPLSFVALPGKCKGATYSLNFDAEQGDTVNHLNCVATLRGIDGSALEASAVYSRERSLSFVFMFPYNLEVTKIDCLSFVCSAGTNLNVRSISEEKIF